MVRLAILDEGGTAGNSLKNENRKIRKPDPYPVSPGELRLGIQLLLFLAFD